MVDRVANSFAALGVKKETLLLYALQHFQKL